MILALVLNCRRKIRQNWFKKPVCSWSRLTIGLSTRGKETGTATLPHHLLSPRTNVNGKTIVAYTYSCALVQFHQNRSMYILSEPNSGPGSRRWHSWLTRGWCLPREFKGTDMVARSIGNRCYRFAYKNRIVELYSCLYRLEIYVYMCI